MEKEKKLFDLINECINESNKKECIYKHNFKDGSSACSIIPNNFDNQYGCICKYQGILTYFNNYGKREKYYECFK